MVGLIGLVGMVGLVDLVGLVGRRGSLVSPCAGQCRGCWTPNSAEVLISSADALAQTQRGPAAGGLRSVKAVLGRLSNSQRAPPPQPGWRSMRMACGVSTENRASRKKMGAVHGAGERGAPPAVRPQGLRAHPKTKTGVGWP